MTVTPQSWAAALLTRMHCPVDANNMTTVLAWEYAEGGHFHNDAHWNPLNTTLGRGTYPSINSDGVVSYPDYRTGLAATARTLREPRYAAVLADLKAAAPPAETTAAVAASPWGTWHGSSPEPLVARAAGDVHAHPSWISRRHANGGQHGSEPRHHQGSPTHGPRPSQSGTSPTSGKKVVLDVVELQAMSTTYRNASDHVQGTIRAIHNATDPIVALVDTLPDPTLAGRIKYGLAGVTADPLGFGQDARLMDQLSQYTEQIHRLAVAADANHDDKWSRDEALDFASHHPVVGKDASEIAAVLAALHSNGTIIRRGENDDGRHGYGSKYWQQHRRDEQQRRRAEQEARTRHREQEQRTRDKQHHQKQDDQHGTNAPTTPHPTPRQQKIDRMITLADKQHVVEQPVNRTKYGEWFGNNGQVWCADFVSWVFAHSGNPLPHIQGPHGFAYVPYAITYARDHHQLHVSPHRGDIFLLKDGSHTGIVTGVNHDGTFDTVEGNSGNQVAHHVRNAHDGSYYFWTAIS